MRSAVSSTCLADETGFNNACASGLSLRNTLSVRQRLLLYSYYKQATCGDCAPECPFPVYNVVDHAKWDAWRRRSGMSAPAAKVSYIDAVGAIVAERRRNAPALPPTPSNSAVGLDLLAAAAPAGANLSAAAARLATPAEAELRSTIATLERNLEALRSRERMRGWMYKFTLREVGFSWGGSVGLWARRYFVLQSSTLLYYGGQGDSTPRRTVQLANCVVVDEGLKKSEDAGHGLKSKRTYHAFSLYLQGTLDATRGPGSGALLRVCCESGPQALEWMRLVAAACGDSEVREWAGEVASARARAALLAEADDALKPAGLRRSAASAPTLTLGAQAAGGGGGGFKPLTRTDSGHLGPLQKGGPRAAIEDAREQTRRKHRKLDPHSFPASKPMHRRQQASLLSEYRGDNVPAQDYAGFFNLGVMIYVLMHARLVLENILRYGSATGRLVAAAGAAAAAAQAALYNPEAWWGSAGGTWGDAAAYWLAHNWLVALVGMQAFVGLAYLIELLPAAGFRPPEALIMTLHVVNILLALGLPMGGVLWYGYPPLHGTLLLLCTVTLFMKLVSYAHVNYDLRLATRETTSTEVDATDVDAKLAKFATAVEDTEGNVHYPANVTLGNLYYFVAAPTLCYQMNFPRTRAVRVDRLVGLVARLVVTWSLVVFATKQYMVPILENAVEHLDAANVPKILERLLKLSLPWTYVWIGGFYGFFHLWMNLLAEVLRFGDREFYRAWWNSLTFEEYWRLWNMPVHNWIVRHLYFPCLRCGLDSGTTGMLAFFVSAVFHEVVIAVPFYPGGFVMPLAFIGMMGQIPLFSISKMINRRVQGTRFSKLGNFLFWFIFCFVGQPLGILVYYWEIASRGKEQVCGEWDGARVCVE